MEQLFRAVLVQPPVEHDLAHPGAERSKESPNQAKLPRPLKHDEDFRISWNQGFI